MKTLYLIRHAKSSWKDISLKDKKRPLNKRGKRDSAFMGQVMNKKGILFDYVMSSPAQRAKSTAKRICEQLNFENKNIFIDNQLYNKDIEGIIDSIKKCESSINSLAVLGHNPSITIACNMFTNEYFHNVSTCGICSIDFNIDSWNEILDSKGNLNFYDIPKKHPELAA